MTMSAVEVIDFLIPSGSGHVLFLPEIPVLAGKGRDELTAALHLAYSQFGLLYQVVVKDNDNSPDTCFAYIRFYSARAASRARSSTASGAVCLGPGYGNPLRVSARAPQGGLGRLPLPRSKCEELANYYLGFNGWTSKILHHRREAVHEAIGEEEEEEEGGDPFAVKFVSVVRLDFPRHGGLYCEGAGLRVDSLIPAEGEERQESVLVGCAKRSLGEAFIAAWGKVVLVVVDNQKVTVEINTAKIDSFFYDPLWESPEVEVKEGAYLDTWEQDDRDGEGECVGESDMV